jgi:hypothetical protein
MQCGIALALNVLKFAHNQSILASLKPQTIHEAKLLSTLDFVYAENEARPDRVVFVA